ncbi:MAG: hypothetical protein AAF289_05665 [Cyanobacteria bacterium P01_A01_bin.135]
MSDIDEAVAASQPPESSLPDSSEEKGDSDDHEDLDVAQTSEGASSPAPQAPTAPVPPWFLGLDIGTLGLSAMLLNRETGRRTPLFWQQEASQQRWFRWPMGSMIDPAETALSSAEAAILCQLKPALALPLRRGLAGTREHLPLLNPVHRPLTQMLATMVPDSNGEEAPWRCGAVGLDSAAFAAAMTNLAGVGASYPAGWSNRYQANVQNAILDANLVAQPSAIHFVQEAIAAALACIPFPETALEPVPTAARAIPPEGLAFVLNAGASTSELAVVDITALAQGDTSVLASQTLGYAGRALEQDILLYLLYPQLQNSPLAEVEQILIALQLDNLEQPRLGQPDMAQRLRLHLRLSGSAPGRQLLAIAQQINQDLQTQPRSTYTLAQHRGQVTQEQLGHQILLPYVHLLTQQAQSLLEQTNITPTAVRYGICSGSTASMRVAQLWIRQRFPKAKVLFSPVTAVLDSGEVVATVAETSWLGSQVSCGLAGLPLVAPLFSPG